MLDTIRRTVRRDTWRDRAARLYSIDPCAVPEHEKLWAIATLRREALHVQKATAPLPEDYGAYSIALALFVARLNDPRAIDSLALVTEIAPAIPSALAAFGDRAVDAVIRTLPSPYLRRSAAYTLRACLASGRLSPGKALAAKRALAQ